MNKKSVIALLLSLVLILSVFCGCSKKTDETITETKETTQSVSLQDDTHQANDTEPDTSGSGSAQGEEYAPAQKDENELEIMTVPPADSQDSSNSQDSADSQKPTTPVEEPDIDDFINSDEPIELPFVPIA